MHESIDESAEDHTCEHWILALYRAMLVTDKEDACRSKRDDEVAGKTNQSCRDATFECDRTEEAARNCLEHSERTSSVEPCLSERVEDVESPGSQATKCRAQ